MKKMTLAVLTTAMALSLSPAAMAGYNGANHVRDHAQDSAGMHGGFTGPSAVAATTVQALGDVRDDTYVTLRGTIVEHLGGEKYLFKDSTGTITVEIDDEDWQGVTAGPTDTVEIYGEVDKGWTKIEVDVDAIKLVK